MTLDNAVNRMTEAAELAAVGIREAGATVTVAVDYMNSFLQATTSSRAKYITVSLVITAEGIPEGEEYCISVGAELRRGAIDKDVLESDIIKFEKMASEARDRICASEDKASAISALATEASREFEELVAKLNEDHKKQRIISAIGMALVIVGIVILFIVATLEGLK